MAFSRVKTFKGLKNSQKAFFASALAFIIILGAILSSNLESSSKKISRIVSTFQSEIFKQENIADKHIQLLWKDIQNHPVDSVSKICFKHLEKDNEPGMTFLIYYQDSLVYWSTNDVSIVELGVEQLTKHRLIQLPNGNYNTRFSKEDRFTIVGLILVNHQYAFENQYLINNYNSCFNLPLKTRLNFDKKSSWHINDKDDKYLFSLDFSHVALPTTGSLQYIVLLYFIAYILILVALYQVYLILINKMRRRQILIIAFTLDVFIFRFLLFYFQVPALIYQSQFFSPVFLASSQFFPSPGDLLLNGIAFFFIAYAIFKSSPLKLNPFFNKPPLRYFMATLGLALMYSLFQISFYQIHEIILNSTISFNLSNISSISVYTQLGLFSIGLILLSVFLVSYRLALFIINSFKSFGLFILFACTLLVILTLAFEGLRAQWMIPLVICILLAVIWYNDKMQTKGFKLDATIYLIFIFSLYTTYIFQLSNQEKEQGKRKIFSEKILLNRDPLLEYNFMKIRSSIKSDTFLLSFLNTYPFSTNIEQDKFNQYLISNYFRRIDNNYDVMITMCDSAKRLELQPNNLEVNCFQYFQNDIDAYGKATDCENLFYMDYDYDNDNYLGQITLDEPIKGLRLFIELFPKNAPKGLGYPELLADKTDRKDLTWTEYSYAKFEDKQLINWFGRYFYSSNFLQGLTVPSGVQAFYFNKDGYNHLVYLKDDHTALIVSKKNPDWLDVVAPFSYLSIFYGLLVFLFLLVLRGGEDITFFPLSFKKRLQLIITSLIVFSFLFIGIGSLFYLISLNNQKNNDILKEKAHSVLIELEHKLAEEETLPISMQPYLNDLLYKFSLVFFSDINLYSTDGKLLASSRPEIFSKGLISYQMEPSAYYAIHFEGSSFFIQHEEIGDYRYLSAFMPFRNTSNHLIAYINLPYFAKQDELTNEISTFLVAFINIYIVFIALAIYLALIVSNYITRPIQLLKEKISGLKLGKKETKIDWQKKDEIGELVIEYNRMVDELASSADKLAKSERETAWREMAKQIAHEIKNPLTPMKLSVQYLQKAWNEKDPDWDDRLKRFTETIIEQINSLSIIASEFSDFAKMPRSSFREIELVKVIRSAIDLFNNTTSIKFNVIANDHCKVYADKEQLLRVFNNLIKNSIQAISNENEGVISIEVSQVDDKSKIVFSDNGKGIPEEEQAKVFYPNFTTKSGGMGLGLAMVKNIITNANGSISFSSEIGEGTSFTILLPRLPQNE